MRYRTVGHSGLKVSAVSLGSWLTFGNTVGDGAARDCIHAALDAGVNFLDTADVYATGEAELSLGRLLPKLPRRELVIATKVFGAMSEGVTDRGLSRKHIIDSCHDSLRRLHIDRIDLYQCHRYDEDTPLEETVRAMSDLIAQGKVHYWGVSCWSPEQIRAAVAIAKETSGRAPISNQPCYNLLERDIEAEVIPCSQQQGLSQVIFSPLAQGILTGKYLDGAVPAGSRLANEDTNHFMKRSLTAKNDVRVRALGELAAELHTTLAQLSLAWCLRLDNVASVITGATRLAQVQENLAAVALELDQATLDRIESITTTRRPTLESG